jgi:macrolide transport system ATP-binding/permease protein
MNQTPQPLLEVTNLVREFPAGESTIQILKSIDLKIYPGELVAIVGQSGSGKSTLMNILGCLDQPSSGSYRVNGRETGELEPDELAQLRREYFGFIFQRYHLLGDLTAAGNVEVPAIYAGIDTADRQKRSTELLTNLGLGNKTENKPSQLSGGQQQRVSIARALMNGGDVILADEPTGALDKNSGIEVMRILRELNAKGHTIILVTHDHNVAKNATRIIEISDGHIISDEPNTPEVDDGFVREELKRKPQKKIPMWRAMFDRIAEAFSMALMSMNAHRMRTFLTMLGIIIGIASVVSIVGLGNGARKEILNDINKLGTNTIFIYQGRGFGDNSRTSQARTLIPADADALAEQPYVASVSPFTNTNAILRFKEIEASATINGVNQDYFDVMGLKFSSGQPFDKSSVIQQAQDVVIDNNTKQKLFADIENPVGQVFLLGSVPSRVIGVLEHQKSNLGGNSDALNVYLPHTTVMSRMLGQSHVRQIVVRIKDGYSNPAAENAILSLLARRHGALDIFTQNLDSIRETIEQTTKIITMMISSIAVISLVVGGIGVMNIMLVSVIERIQEIGVRMAVGARQSDILQQFLIEAILVCLLGGVIGVLLALGIGQLINQVAASSGSTFRMIYSMNSMIIAFICSSLIGIVFGFLPARNAARLNPVDALSRE